MRRAYWYHHQPRSERLALVLMIFSPLAAGALIIVLYTAIRAIVR